MYSVIRSIESGLNSNKFSSDAKFVLTLLELYQELTIKEVCALSGLSTGCVQSCLKALLDEEYIEAKEVVR